MNTTTTLKANDLCWCGSGKKFKRCHKVATDRIRPGHVSPRRSVPDEVVAPHYAATGARSRRGESMVKDADTIERMRRTGAAAAEILREVGAAVAPGDHHRRARCAVPRGLPGPRAAIPSPLNYGGFPKSVCTSVNEVICHGIPDDRALREGDIVNIDVTLFREGVHGDTNATFFVGQVDAASAHLVDTTRACLEAGLAAVTPGPAHLGHRAGHRGAGRGQRGSRWCARSSVTASAPSSTPPPRSSTTTTPGPPRSCGRA